ncbi:peroxisome biogenesis factor 10-like [Carica papaya]|uniref:peroxisome biogenesis factor 10-like n=1 Tax=Carica papaya TaxID=3649 RepID=UPI000B8C7CAD|nr:peroxisome biogenesis factor 10-like [Carica papaya]
MDYYELIAKSSFHDSLKILEAHVQYANALASSLPRGKSSLHMKLAYSHLASVFLFLLHWVDTSCSCLFTTYLNLFHIVVHKVHPDGRPSVSTCARKATIREFYSVILPSLQHLHADLSDIDIAREGYNTSRMGGERVDDKRRFPDIDLESEDECGICLEPGTKMVLPNCCHEMCIKCFHDWNNKSESCPFCRGSLRRVNSEDLWVLTCSSDVVETQTVLKEDVLRLYLYINALPKDTPDALSLINCEYVV